MAEESSNHTASSYQNPVTSALSESSQCAKPINTTESINRNKFVAFRPRILYCSLFVWNTVTVGKFIAPLLQELSPKFSESVIGEVLAIQYGIVACFAGWGGSLADKVERRSSRWGQGRLLVIAGSVLLGTIAFLGHAVPDYLGFVKTIDTERAARDVDTSWDFLLFWHVLMRFIYAIGMAICAPAIDGLALAHLDTMEGGTQAEFGKERMYGALFWGFGSLANGVGIDHFGFGFLYFMVVASTVTTYLIIGVYMWGLSRDTTGNFAPKNDDMENKQSTTLERCTEQIHGLKGKAKAVESKTLSTREICMLFCKTSYGISFAFFLFVLSSGISVVDNLAFIFFALLGSSDTTNGWTVVFTVLMEVPCFYLAPELLKRHGPFLMMIYAGAAYVIRVFGYTLVPPGHMGLILLLETFHGVTYACQKVGSVEYVARIVPKGYEASGQGILLLVNYFGVVVGLFVAGWMQEAFGPRIMYAFMGFIVFLGMIVLVIAEKCEELNVSKEKEEKNNEQTRLLKKSNS